MFASSTTRERWSQVGDSAYQRESNERIIDTKALCYLPPRRDAEKHDKNDNWGEYGSEDDSCKVPRDWVHKIGSWPSLDERERRMEHLCLLDH